MKKMYSPVIEKDEKKRSITLHGRVGRKKISVTLQAVSVKQYTFFLLIEGNEYIELDLDKKNNLKSNTIKLPSSHSYGNTDWFNDDLKGVDRLIDEVIHDIY